MQEHRALLRKAGLRVTEARVQVLAALEKAKRPLSHGELSQRLVPATGDQATVYRNLQRLLDAGLVRIASDAGGLRRFERAGSHALSAHPHFVCENCGVVTCLPEADLKLHVNHAWAESLSSARIQVLGQCPTCTSP